MRKQWFGRAGLVGVFTIALMAWGLAGPSAPAHAATTSQDVVAAFASGGSLTLDSDVTVSQGLTLDRGVDLKLDLGGHTLTIAGSSGSDGSVGATGVDGPQGAPGASQPGGAGGVGADGGDGRTGLSIQGGVLRVVHGSLTVTGGVGGTGGTGGTGGAGGTGIPAPLIAVDGGAGGAGGDGGVGGHGGAGIDNDGILLVSAVTLTVTGGAGGAGGQAGAGGAGGDGVAGVATAADGGAGGAGGTGGAGGQGGDGVVNNGPILMAGGSIPLKHGASGAGGGAGLGGSGGLGSLDDGHIGSSGDAGATGAVGAAGSDGAVGADVSGSDAGMTTLDGNGSDDPIIGWAWVSSLSRVVGLQGELGWPTRAGFTFTAWYEDPEGTQYAQLDGNYAGRTVYAQWQPDTTCTGPTNAASAASAFSGATDGSTITLCGDITVASTDAGLAVPADTSVTLNLNGHTLTATGAGGKPALGVATTSALTVTDSSATSTQPGTGRLTLTGGDQAAGLGSGWNVDAGDITIKAGTVSATGGCGGAGIGAGWTSDAGTVTIDGGTVTAQGGPTPPRVPGGDPVDPCSSAGIGGGDDGKGGAVTINGGTVTATGSWNGAGVGSGGSYGGVEDDSFTMTAGTLIATGGSSAVAPGWPTKSGAAGIGSAANRAFGPLEISGGTVTAVGGAGAAGIGGGSNGSVASVTISGGTVTTTGGTADTGDYPGGAGIGSGAERSSGPVTISGGTVVATGGTGGAGIGGGSAADGPAVSIGARAKVSVTASGGGNAIGQGAGTGTFGSLSNAGELTITTGTVLTIPDGVRMTNSGTLITEKSKQSGTPNGAVINNGIIDNTGTVETPGDVSVHNYLLSFDMNGGSGNGSGTPRVYAPTLGDVHAALPPDPTRSGFTFQGWNSEADGSGVTLSSTTDLTFAGDGPRTITWFAQWAAVPPPLVVTTDQLPEGTVGVSYEAHLTASGGADDHYTWKLESGDLPPGLTLNADGTISGIPTTTGTFEFRVSVNDPAYANLSITIRPADVTTPPPTQPPTTTPPPATTPPATTAPPTSAPATTTPPISPPPLANTGGPGAGGLITGVILLAAGLGLVVRRRRRPGDEG